MRTTTILILLVIAALTRVFPHPPNFAPIAAMALFGAIRFQRKSSALMFPLAAMLVSDLAIEGAYRLGLSQSWGIHRGMWVIYLLMMMIGALGLLFKDKKTGFGKIVGLSLTSSVLFFVLSNLAVWISSSVYDKSLQGLLTCYTAAVPFFQWTVLGDLCYCGILFGSWALMEWRVPLLTLRQNIGTRS
jgi:hypothetical protein